jgi:TRAP-type uncharacterized transport system fused permease subunit
VLITGYATATECAAYGVVGALALAAWGGSLTWSNFWEGLMGTARSSCMIMFILAGAAFLTKTMAFTGIPRELAEWVNAMQLSPMALIAVLTVVYLILGTALDGISMIVLTSAVVLPMIQKAGFDLIWFGIFIVLLLIYICQSRGPQLAWILLSIPLVFVLLGWLLNIMKNPTVEKKATKATNVELESCPCTCCYYSPCKCKRPCQKKPDPGPCIKPTLQN